MRVAAIGDNCIDIYKNPDRKYPTGNVVDTGVNLQKLGVPVSIISTTGNDENGKWMLDTLKNQGLDTSHLKIAQGPTAVTWMEMDGKERVHSRYEEGVLADMVFSDEDIAFAAQHTMVHSARWGKAEDALPRIKAAGTGTLISFDYAHQLDHPMVESTLPYVDYGFYSYGKPGDTYIRDFLADKCARGMKLAIATFGKEGSLACDGKRFVPCGIVPAQVVNTVGAGDSFIAGVLYGLLHQMPLEACLQQGAKTAASVISVFGPWVDNENAV